MEGTRPTAAALAAEATGAGEGGGGDEAAAGTGVGAACLGAAEDEGAPVVSMVKSGAPTATEAWSAACRVFKTPASGLRTSTETCEGAERWG